MRESQSSDEQYMCKALELARAGVGLVSPNPAVGAVVIDSSGREVGAGTHTYDGIKHAEVLALQQAGESAQRDRKSTRLNSSHTVISYAVFCLKKKKHPQDTI